VYDGVLREVLRAGGSRPVREVAQLLAADLRTAFGQGMPQVLADRSAMRDAEEIAAGRRVVVTSQQPE
jgi:hypothetical protein